MFTFVFELKVNPCEKILGVMRMKNRIWNRQLWVQMNQKKSACFSLSKPPKFPSPGDQPGVFQGISGFLKYGHFDEHFSYNKRKKDPTEKKNGIHLGTLKTAF